jgi:hypothetical protein
MPYPNTIQHSDGMGSSKVLTENQQTLRKGDTFRMSTGDEAGTALGVVSNTIKGMGEIKQGCDTVKVEGKDVAYLLVTVEHNGQSRKNGLNGKAVKPGQTRRVLRMVNSKRRRVTAKARKFVDDGTKLKPNAAVTSAAAAVGQARSATTVIAASEALGEAGGLQALGSIASGLGGLVGKAMVFAGAGVVDVMGLTAAGVLIVIEAKGGGSGLGYRFVDGIGYVYQGTPQYLMDIGIAMAASSVPAVRAAGQLLLNHIAAGTAQYFQAKTGYRRRPFKPNPVKVQKFDP